MRFCWLSMKCSVVSSDRDYECTRGCVRRFATVPIGGSCAVFLLCRCCREVVIQERQEMSDSWLTRHAGVIYGIQLNGDSQCLQSNSFWQTFSERRYQRDAVEFCLLHVKPHHQTHFGMIYPTWSEMEKVRTFCGFFCL